MNRTIFKDERENMDGLPIILCLIFILPLGVYMVLRYHPDWFKKIWLIVVLAVYALIWNSAILSGLFDLNKGLQENSQDKLQVSQTIETKILTEVKSLAFSIERVDAPKLTKGDEKVEREGIDGEITITYEVKLENGREIAKTIINEEVTAEPVNKLIKIGTYVAPTAKSDPPMSSNTQSQENSNLPLKAICKDGTTSYQDTASHPNYQGMCSGHGGIQTRLGRVP